MGGEINIDMIGPLYHCLSLLLFIQGFFIRVFKTSALTHYHYDTKNLLMPTKMMLNPD